MRTIFIVFMNNVKRAFNEKNKLLINLLVPIITIILSILVSYTSKPSINIGVVQKADFSEGNRILSLLKATDNLNVYKIDNSLIKTKLILGKYDGVIVINKKFEKGSIKNVDKYFSFYSVEDNKTKDNMRKIVRAYLMGNTPIKVKAGDISSGTLTKGERIISFLSTVLLIAAVVNAAVVIKDRTENILYRFMYSPNKRFQYILGNVIYNYIFTYIQVFIAILVVYFCGVDIGIPIYKVLGYGLILTLVMTSFGTMIACIFNKELYANLFAATISLILSLIGGTFITYDKMPKGLQSISAVTPERWIIKSVQYMEGTLRGGVNPVIVLLVFSAIFAFASVALNSFHKVEFK